ncbi:MAG: PaaI family thioesterase [Alphaproteobacteria bacterium]|nr:MAG: PaaI family thioesterase [Alphaproteobacteria bacterium]
MTSASIPEGFRPFAARSGYVDKIGPLYFKRDGEQYTYGFLADESHANANGIVHGGMMMSFLDEALGNIIWRLVGRKRCATISLNCDFVSAGRVGDWIEVNYEISRHGVSVVFIRGELVARGEKIMTADGIWKIIGK